MPIKGAKEFKKFQDGKPLTRKESLLAQCYECNGYEAQDCLGNSCPLYQWSPYRKITSLKPQTFKKLNPEQIKKLQQGRIKAKQASSQAISTQEATE